MSSPKKSDAELMFENSVGEIDTKFTYLTFASARDEELFSLEDWASKEADPSDILSVMLVLQGMWRSDFTRTRRELLT
jgi:hypothetical protein